MVDWGQALKIFGIGFGGVFIILIILMLCIIVIGAITRRIEKTSPPEKEPAKK